MKARKDGLLFGLSVALFLAPASGGVAKAATSATNKPSGLISALLSLRTLAERALPDPPEPPPPAVDAPTEQLVAYWTYTSWLSGRVPGHAVARRLLVACEEKPERLPSLLNCMPDTPDAHRRIKQILDRATKDEVYAARERNKVRRWLMLRSRYFRAELVRAARAANFEKGWLAGRAALDALAKLAPRTAARVLKKHLKSDDIRLKTEALAGLYAIAMTGGDMKDAAALREKLTGIVSDEAIPPTARARACKVVLEHEWQGRDEYYLSLLRIPWARCLQEEDYYRMSPLQAFAASDPDKWVPILTTRVGHRDRAIHNNAVLCLIQFAERDRWRADALEPLLPWLSDPRWALESVRSEDGRLGRLRLVQALHKVDLPQSVPGLLYVAANETDAYLSAASTALAKYRATKAVPILKAALSREPREYCRRTVIRALESMDGFTDKEIVQSVEAYASQISTAAGRKEREEIVHALTAKRGLPGAVTIGDHFQDPALPSDSVARRLLQRAKAVRAHKPAVAEKILEIVESWPVDSVATHLLRRVEADDLSATTVMSIVRQREFLRRRVAPGLTGLLARGGNPAGLAAFLLEDKPARTTLMKGTDTAAQQMLLACARLAGDSLELDDVASLLASGDAGLAQAAERYLLEEDSPHAVGLLRRHYAGEIVILGRGLGGTDPSAWSPFSGLEKHLCERLKSDESITEIYALLAWSADARNTHQIALVRDRGVELCIYHHSGSGKRELRDLDRDEWERVHSFIHSNRVDELPRLDTAVCDGTHFEYLHLSRHGGRRVYMSNPGIGAPGSMHHLLTTHFLDLSVREPTTVEYVLSNWLPGVEVLFSERRRGVYAVCEGDKGLQVLVRQRRYADEHKCGWHVFRDGKLGVPVAQEPVPWPSSHANDGSWKDMNCPEHLSGRPWEDRIGDRFVRVSDGTDTAPGLMLCKTGEAPQLLLRDAYGPPIVTPDQKWLIATKVEGTDSRGPGRIIRFDLERRIEHRTDVTPARRLWPVAFVSAHGQVLLERLDDQTATAEPNSWLRQSEYILLDPATGKATGVEGEFWPWGQVTYRPLQPTGQPNEVWAARPRYTEEEGTFTAFGRYDTKAFSFQVVLKLPTVRFNSMEMWVDQRQRVIYAVTNGDLLRIPMPAENDPPPAHP